MSRYTSLFKIANPTLSISGALERGETSGKENPTGQMMEKGLCCKLAIAGNQLIFNKPNLFL